MRRLLHEIDYTLPANVKSLSVSSKERDQQFHCIARQRRRFCRCELPIISVDTKKKELVGNFKNPGRVWSQQAVPVNDHDFRSQGLGMASPYGIFDVTRNRGSVFIGTSHGPALRRRILRAGGAPQDAKSIPTLRNYSSCGSNGARVRAWKYELYWQLVEPFDLEITVCYYPTGASKWNPIEHRFFSEISKGWAGQPLESYETIQSLINQTTTKTGLRAHAFLVSKRYATGQKVSDQQMREIRIHNHAILPTWNYTLRPVENRN